MKCPHCDYVHGWDAEKMEVVKGKEGDFYKLPVEMTRSRYGVVDRRDLYACPSCRKTFIGDI
jgi:hypothetical protein